MPGIQLDGLLVPKGSLVLVTAANGLISSHVVDQLLDYGFKVRGTVRSLERTSWLKPLLQSRHPESHLEIVEVPDTSAKGCFDEVFKGVSAIIHIAANTVFTPDSSYITEALELYENILNAALAANKSGEQIKRFAFTSSSWAVAYPTPNTPLKITSATYNDAAGIALKDPNTPDAFRPVLNYCEAKKQTEQFTWKWLKEHPDAGFTVNSVIPGTCIGPVLSAEHQAFPSTVGFVRSLYEGLNKELFDWMEPQWYVDVRDAARLHIAAAVFDGVEGERVFAYAERYTWVGVKEVLESEMGKKVPIDVKGRGEDISELVGVQEKSEALLGRLGQKGWVKFDDSVRETIRAFYPKEKST